MLTIGILGCGRIGKVHAASIAAIPNARLGAVADAMSDAAEALAQEHGAAAKSPEAIIADAAIDAVIVASPTTTHYDLIHSAAAAGKAIFCEKPIDLSADRIRDCLKAVESGGVPFFTAFNRRFDPNFAHLEHQLREGVIGDIEIINILSRDPSPPPISYIESSGGIFRDMMIHDFDMARFLLGEEPTELHASASCLVDPEIGKAGDFDTAVVTLKTASGKLCQISNSRRATYGYDQRIEVHGAKGLLRAENMLENTVELATEAGFQRAPTQHFFLERYSLAYKIELQHFVDAVVAGDPITPTGIDGLKAQLLADAATESAADGLMKTV